MISLTPRQRDNFLRLLPAERDASSCWEWQGARRTKLPYGQFSVGGKNMLAHRIAYEVFVGPIPDGLTLDHLCRNHPCCNPAHLEPVTLRENVQRALLDVLPHKACRNGHPYPDGPVEKIRGGRRCLICAKANKARELEARKISRRGRSFASEQGGK